MIKSKPDHFHIITHTRQLTHIRICCNSIDEDEMDWLLRYANGRKIRMVACDYKIEVSITPR